MQESGSLRSRLLAPRQRRQRNATKQRKRQRQKQNTRTGFTGQRKRREPKRPIEEQVLAMWWKGTQSERLSCAT
eukprot:3438088-Amphidinium_carterae.1